MRIDRFSLLRYGHFSDQRLDFQRNEHDFHLILGGNEAGKSTLRQAFHDLLFGIPMNTAMAFLHDGRDLALDAVLSGTAGELGMGRRRKRVGGLVDSDGQALAPEVLARWLGDVSEAFYERMFGLDHRRLEQGSRAMLQAGDDVDAVLFQAAAGLATLNGVLTALREEAAGIWTPHHSRTRAWYSASDRYKAAEKAVKDATVRPTRWADVQRESRRLDQAFDHARDACASLRNRLRELERLRRLAPLLAQIRECEGLLGSETTARPGQASLLAHEADILALEENRLRVAGHGAGMEQCRAQIGLLREQLDRAMRQLGRTAVGHDSAALTALAAGLPPLPLRHEIARLLTEGRELLAKHVASQRAREARLAELNELRTRIRELPGSRVHDGLRRALDAAAAPGDLNAAITTLERRVAQEEAERGRRLAALQRPGMSAPPEVGQLTAMMPWSAEALVEHAQERRERRAALDAAATRVADVELERRAAELKTEQFRRSHQAVSRDQVMAARRERDELWQALAEGGVVLREQAERYASLVLHADVLVDRHLEAVDDAARLQALEHECERLQAAVLGLEALHSAAESALLDSERAWQRACSERMLPEMSPAELQGWLPGREAALQAHERLSVARQELVALRGQHDTLLRALQAALSKEAPAAGQGDGAEITDLSLACSAARALLQQAETTAARRQALSEQSQRLELLLPVLEQDCRRDEAAYAQWMDRRQAVLSRAGLPPEADDAYVESALGLLAEADALLEQLREQQAEHDRLDAGLRHFGEAVGVLAARLPDAGDAAAPLETRLRTWVAQLVPLREAQRDREQARQRLATLNTRLLEEAGGRNRGQVEAELGVVDISTLAGEAEALEAQINDAEQKRDRLALEREQARAALEAISGADDAAQAESRRQEALADMADAAERYAQLYAQYRLLEHITERYRERSQGPLLARAGQLFSALTLGAHEGLEIDGDAATLSARRAGGKLTALEGLSDGTRDQLYLALRLAALERYLDHAEGLPFIADDLFVNYDDGRTLAGLTQLSEVSRRTQVIFLTHHARVAELAHDHLADRINIIELPGGGAAGPAGA